MTANSFIAVDGRVQYTKFRHCLKGAGELLLALNSLHFVKVMDIALLPRFNHLLKYSVGSYRLFLA